MLWAVLVFFSLLLLHVWIESVCAVGKSPLFEKAAKFTARFVTEYCNALTAKGWTGGLIHELSLT